MAKFSFKEAGKAAVLIAMSQLAGAIGGIATSSSVNTWYQDLKKPSYTPADWVFGPVWVTLYAMMGIAAYLAWRKRGQNRDATKGLIFFFIQLGLNALWSILFFGMEWPGGAAAEIVVLWVTILVTTVFFFRVSRVAGALMIPYILWVSFAVALNVSIWNLNR